MAMTTSNIRFNATLLRPKSPKGATWAFLVLPADGIYSNALGAPKPAE